MKGRWRLEEDNLLWVVEEQMLSCLHGGDIERQLWYDVQIHNIEHNMTLVRTSML